MTTAPARDELPLNRIPRAVRTLPLLTFMIFDEVLRSRSGAGAAERLGVSEATISKHVRQLELAVGTPLIRRTSDGPVATATGQVVRDIARAVVTQARHLSATVERSR